MYYRRSSFGIGGGALTPAIKNLLFANGVVFVLQFNPSLDAFLTSIFALHPITPARPDIRPIEIWQIWQLVSYMFFHGGFFHIFFNMFVLWMFGTELEREWGTKQFLKYYFLTGIGAGAFNLLMSGYPTIGASGAVYGVMLAYALRYPDREVYLYFLFPIKIKYLMGFLFLVSFIYTFGDSPGGVAHAAHMGGIVVGFIYLKYWNQFYKIKSWFQKSQTKSSPNMKYHQGGNQKVEYYRKKIDEILDKINRVGYLNLSDEEKELLEEGSKYLREHDETDIN